MPGFLGPAQHLRLDGAPNANQRIDPAQANYPFCISLDHFDPFHPKTLFRVVTAENFPEPEMAFSRDILEAVIDAGRMPGRFNFLL